MNPLTKVKLINELNAREADLGVQDKVSWHSEYKDSAWIFLGGLPYELTEGDIICVFSQYGEIVNINLVRDKKTGKSKGFCFICYEDQRSTILAVDNFNGIKIKGRTIRVDHVANYRLPNDGDDVDAVTKKLREEGCAPKAPPSAPDSSESSEEDVSSVPAKKLKKEKKKKKKKEKKEKKVKVKKEAASKQFFKSSGRNQSPPPPVRIKREREDVEYEKYAKMNHDIHWDGSVDRRNEERGKGDARKHTDGADEMRTREKHRERSRPRNSEREEKRNDDQNGRGSGNERSERDIRHTHGDGRELRYDEERHSGQEKMRKEDRIDSKNDDRDKYKKYNRSKREERDSRCDSMKHKEWRFEHDKVNLNKGRYNYRDSDHKRN
ncbi:RNA-binding motif protein, X-linked 2 [Chiloscyllium punctatum]|uniref:RNA-binding motif protein, X-linked 2 n=1 Tax=Chiloscyllium punctatum TaxID=137246 RepID=A0A401S1W6_CHIPU|nr:hypothetical protein [Chiloscyllium punctatum]